MAKNYNVASICMNYMGTWGPAGTLSAPGPLIKMKVTTSRSYEVPS